MAYSTDVAAARLLATQAHFGQTDKAGAVSKRIIMHVVCTM